MGKIEPTMSVIKNVGVLRDPVTRKLLPDDVAVTVPKNSYWMRRLLCNDVKLSKAQSPKKIEQKTSKLHKDGN